MKLMYWPPPRPPPPAAAVVVAPQVNLGSALRHQVGYCVMSGTPAAASLALARTEIFKCVGAGSRLYRCQVSAQCDSRGASLGARCRHHSLMRRDAFKRFAHTQEFARFCVAYDQRAHSTGTGSLHV